MSNPLFFRFFFDDWLRDTRFISPAAKGAWIDFICHAWSLQQATLQAHPKQMSRWCGCSEEEFLGILLEWKAFKIADVTNNQDGTLTIECRRMHKDLILNQEARAKASEKGKKAALAKARKRTTSTTTGSTCGEPQVQLGVQPSATSATSAVVTTTATKAPPPTSGESGYPTMEEAQAYASSQTERLIKPEWVEKWWLDRDRKDWCHDSRSGPQPIPKWRADLQFYAKTWKDNEDAKASKLREKEALKRAKEEAPEAPTPLSAPEPSNGHENPFETAFAEKAERRRKHEEWLATPHAEDEISPYLS